MTSENLNNDLKNLLLVRGSNCEWLNIPEVARINVQDDGRVEVRWSGDTPSVCHYASLRDVWKVHVKGHNKPPMTTAIVTLDRQFELSLDPWHADAFIGTPAEGVFESKGERRLVWLEVDWCGNALGVVAWA